MSQLRQDPITGRWVIIAPERLRGRRLDGAAQRVEGGALAPQHLPRNPVGAIDGDMCPFCEGQEGVAGRELLAWRPDGSAANGPGWQVRVVANRNPVLRVESELGEAGDGLFHSRGGLGAHEVVIESPDHHVRFDTMSADAIMRVLWAWRERIRDLRRDIRLKSFLVVKNVGALAGATLDHPHSQLLALPLVPQHVRDEMVGAAAYQARTGRCVFCDLVEQELSRDRRVVASDDLTMAFTPFASRVPFETWILPRTHQAAFEDASDAVLAALGERLRDLMRRLDATLVLPPYSLLLHTSQAGEENTVSYHWHIEILPRLTPISGVAWDGGVHVNPVAPEEAAEALRDAAF